MTNEQKLDRLIECAVRFGQGKVSNKSKVEQLRTELLSELAASQPGEPGKAQCPQGSAQHWRMSGKLYDPDAEHRFWTDERVEKFSAQFFRPSALSPLPSYEEAKPHLGYAWPGYSFDGKEEEIRYAFNRMRAAMQKCMDVAPSGSAGQEPDRLKLAESLEHAARCFYGEQYGDSPLEPEMITFAARFAACQLTGYKTEEEELNERTNSTGR